jgi:hypothetical protein
MGEKRNAYRLLVGKPGRPKRRWVNNIKRNEKCENINECGLFQNAFPKSVMTE